MLASKTHSVRETRMHTGYTNVRPGKEHEDDRDVRMKNRPRRVQYEELRGGSGAPMIAPTSSAAHPRLTAFQRISMKTKSSEHCVEELGAKNCLIGPSRSVRGTRSLSFCECPSPHLGTPQHGRPRRVRCKMVAPDGRRSHRRPPANCSSRFRCGHAACPRLRGSESGSEALQRARRKRGRKLQGSQ